MQSSKKPKCNSHVRQDGEYINDRRVVQKIKRVVLENTGNELVSLYLIGSFVSKDMVESSDIDLVGIMKPSFDFNKERRINNALNHQIPSTHRIDLGTMSITELYGSPRKGSIMKHVELPILLNYLKQARLIHGKQINFNKLPVKSATPKDELRYHIKTFNEYKEAFRERDRIGADFAFKDFLKVIFYIAHIELQLTQQITTGNYSEIVKAFAKDKTHPVHDSMRLRLKKTISSTDRRRWLNVAEGYVAEMMSYATEE